MSTLTTKGRAAIAPSQFAFPKQGKEPLENASHVRNAIARFDQVQGVTDAERDDAWQRILSAARTHGVEVHEHSWRQLGAGSGKPRGDEGR